MALKIIVFAALCCLLDQTARAGDAVVIGYGYDGVWVAVTYDRSSTPKGGTHYRPAAEAAAFARRDLCARAGGSVAMTKIVGQCDRTGYVAVAEGKAPVQNRDVTAVGRGKSQADADQKALTLLSETGVTANERILYRYFSYGEDPALSDAKKSHSARRIAFKVQATDRD